MHSETVRNLFKWQCMAYMQWHTCLVCRANTTLYRYLCMQLFDVNPAPAYLVPSPLQKERAVCCMATAARPVEDPGSDVCRACMTVAVSSCLAEAASEGASLVVAMVAKDSQRAVGSQCITSWPVSGCVCTLPITWEAPPAAKSPHDVVGNAVRTTMMTNLRKSTTACCWLRFVV